MKAFLLPVLSFVPQNQQELYRTLASVSVSWHHAATGRPWVAQTIRSNLEQFSKRSIFVNSTITDMYELYFEYLIIPKK